MSLLQFERNQVQAFVNQAVMRPENLVHWDVCKALASGQTIERVAEDFKMSTRNVDLIKSRKCKDC